jgi:hypothetical protein
MPPPVTEYTLNSDQFGVIVVIGCVLIVAALVACVAAFRR